MMVNNAERKALVFDTNFIIENKDLDNVVEEAEKNGYTVYVPQVAIDERLSQKYINLKEKYKELSELKNKFSEIADIAEKIDFPAKYKASEKKMQNNYKRLFVDNIIPFDKDAETFCSVWDRVHKKLPPFRAIPEGGDKGFKDVLLWLSMIRFFKENGENEVLFLTNDKDFLKNSDSLKTEFKDLTSKEIEIKSNEYYKDLTKLDNSAVDEKDTLISHEESNISFPTEEEIKFIVALLRSQDSPDTGVNIYSIKKELEKCGLSNVYFSLGLRSLEKKDFIVVEYEEDYNWHEYFTVKLTEKGSDWVSKNTEIIYKVDANTTEKTISMFDDELPF